MKKERIKKQYEKSKLRVCASASLLAFSISRTMYCSADTDSDAKNITQPIDNLKLLVLAGIAGYGVIILAKNVSEFAQAYQQQDTSGMHNGLKGILAGILMTGISSVVAFIQGS